MPTRRPPSKTASSTPRLSSYAKKFTYPQGSIVRTAWPRVEAKGRELGLGFDWWQSQLGTVCLGYGADGKYAATVGGIGLSIPRQVGKTYFALATLVIMCILFPGLQVVWTAHHLRTTTKTFTTLRGICRRKKVAPHIAVDGRGQPAIRSSNGEQQVTFVNGSTIYFGARSQGFGRGFDEVDVEVFDEAQILDTKALEDMIAATNQARHEHGALLFFMGTPPRPTDSSESFSQRRREAWRGEAEDAVWLEMGADPKSDPNDEAQWPLMNPSYPSRTPRESMLRLRKNLKSEDSWNREGRGVWDIEDSKGALSISRWAGLADPGAERGNPVAFGLDLSGDRDVWIAVAWRRTDGHIHVMLTNDGNALPPRRVVDEGARLSREWGGAVATSAFGDDLETAGVQVVDITAAEFAIGCGAVADAITDGTIRHGNQPALNTAVKEARWRSTSATSGERAFQLKDCPEVGPLAAVARAVRGLASMSTDPFNVW